MMKALRRFFARIRNVASNRRIDARLQEEIEQHIAMQAEENMREGMSREEARRKAVLKFGPVESVREDCHDEEGLPLVESLLLDLRYALRVLLKSPAFTIVAVLTLALGIGANTTVFSVVDAVLLRPLPYMQPERLVDVQSSSKLGTAPGNISYPDFLDWRAQNRSFEHLVSYHDSSYALTGAGQPAHVEAEVVSWDLLPMLGASPEIGRGFTKEEERRGTHVVLLSHALWTSEFGADKAVVGRIIHLSGDEFTVIGVMPKSFRFPITALQTGVWTTFAVDDTVEGDGIKNRGMHWLNAVGRLKPEVTLTQAGQDMQAIALRLTKQYPDTNTERNSVHVESELDAVLGNTKTLIVVIQCAVSLVLLIACGNIANLLLARLSDRRREIAMRSALGASRTRIIRQLMMESMVLSLGGGVSGCVLAFLCTPLVLRLIGESVPRAADAGVSLPVLGFGLCVTMMTGIVFGIIPAIKASKTDLVSTLKTGSISDVAGSSRLRSAVIIGQVALGIVLSSGAGLLISSFVRLMRQDMGFASDRLLTFRFETPDSRYKNSRLEFNHDYFQKLRALPGVRSAAGTLILPMGGDDATISFQDPEHPLPDGQLPAEAASLISTDYFRTMQTPILKGRDFTDGDRFEAPQVMLINQAFADKYFAGKDPIGKKLKPGAGDQLWSGGPPMRQIVGVVGNMRDSMTQKQQQPAYYLPASQMPSWCCLISVVKTSVDPHSLEPAIRHLVTSMDKDIPITDVRTMQELMALQLTQPRFAMVLLGAFAGLALLLTVVGLYGVMMYSVSRRTREIGVRLALGAQRATVLRMVLRDASVLLASGIVIGLVATLAFASVMKSMLYRTEERDPLVLVLVCVVVAISGLFAAQLPAMRAAAIEPMKALRMD